MPDDFKAVSSTSRISPRGRWLRRQRCVPLGMPWASPVLRNSELERVLQALDWDNLAEEIEGLARRHRRELASHIVTIIEHLTKLENSSASEPRRGWIDTVEREREARPWKSCATVRRFAERFLA